MTKNIWDDTLAAIISGTEAEKQAAANELNVAFISLFSVASQLQTNLNDAEALFRQSPSQDSFGGNGGKNDKDKDNKDKDTDRKDKDKGGNGKGKGDNAEVSKA